jgi:TonB family protein
MLDALTTWKIRKLISRIRRPSFGTLGWTILISATLHFALIALLSATISPSPAPGQVSIVLQVNLLKHKNKPPIPLSQPSLPPGSPDTPLEQKITGFASPAPPEKLVGIPLKTRYYDVTELDETPKPLTSVEPQYPPEALARHEGSTVQLELFIDEKGEIESLEAISTDSAEMFRESALSAFEQQRFSPGLKNGIPVKSHIKITVKFGS